MAPHAWFSWFAALLTGNCARSKHCTWLGAFFAALCLSKPSAGCGEAFSPCVSLETLLAPTSPSRFVSLHSWEDAERTRVSLDVDYRQRPVVVVAASPDPYGREVPVLTDWAQLALGADAVLSPLRLGFHVPVAVRLSGTGVDGVASVRSNSGVNASFGDPEVNVAFPFRLWGLDGGVIQRLTIPLGTAGSFAAHAGPRYAPVISLTKQFADTLLGAELGLRLRAAERFGDLRFGSEATAQVGVSQRLFHGFSLALEGSLHVALARDETITESGTTIRVRRMPAETLASVQFESEHERLTLGVGTSVPLTQRAVGRGPGVGQERETISGPPGAPLHVALRVERAF
jgi:hypothetical protein